MEESPQEEFRKKKKLKKQNQDNSDSTISKKSRREIVEEEILNKFHQSQQLQGILKCQSNQTNSEGDTSNRLEEPVTEYPTKNEHLEANQVLDDVNNLKREKRKKLAKEKKEFKRKQRQQQKEAEQAKEEEHKEGKQEKALSYLKQWKRHPEDWKFRKNIHIWLIKNWKHSDKVPDKRFKTFLKYIKSTEQKSLALKRLEQEAKKIVDQDKGGEEDEALSALQHRARNILQWIIV